MLVPTHLAFRHLSEDDSKLINATIQAAIITISMQAGPIPVTSLSAAEYDKIRAGTIDILTRTRPAAFRDLAQLTDYLSPLFDRPTGVHDLPGFSSLDNDEQWAVLVSLAFQAGWLCGFSSSASGEPHHGR